MDKQICYFKIDGNGYSRFIQGYLTLRSSKLQVEFQLSLKSSFFRIMPLSLNYWTL